MTQWIEHTINALGYFGIAFLTFAENLFPPIPSEVIMPLAGFTASRGELSVIGAVVAGSVGSLAGTALYYFLGRAVSEQSLRRWVRAHGKWVAVGEDDVDKAMRWFGRHGHWALLVCRFIPGVRTFISLPAGLCGMAFGEFLAYSLVGVVVWTAALTYAGVALGKNYARVAMYIGPIAWIVVGALAAAFAFLVLRRRKGGLPPPKGRTAAPRA